MEVTLKRDGWHRKLQEFVFNNPPRYNSLCPYFWFTVFCIIFTFIIPIVPIIKLIKGIGTLSVFILSWLDTNVCIPMFEAILKNMDDDQVIKNWSVYADHTYRHGNLEGKDRTDWQFWRDEVTGVGKKSWKSYDKMLERFTKWKAITPNWEEKLEEIKARRKSEYEQRIADAKVLAQEKWQKEMKEEELKWIKRRETEKRAEESRIRRQAMFTKIAIYTKWLAYVLVTALAGGIGWGLYLGGKWVYLTVQWAKVWSFIVMIAKPVGLGLLALGVLILLVNVLVKLIMKCEIKPSDSKTLKAIGRFFVTIGNGLYWFGEKIMLPICMFIYNWMLEPMGTFFVFIWEGLKFIGMFLKSAKDNNCPGIIWEDSKSNTN